MNSLKGSPETQNGDTISHPFAADLGDLSGTMNPSVHRNQDDDEHCDTESVYDSGDNDRDNIRDFTQRPDLK